MLLNLDFEGFAVSSGSACTSGSLEPSHVLLATGLSHEISHGSIRVSVGRDNTSAEVERFVSVFPPIVAKLRAMSPLSATRPSSDFEGTEGHEDLHEGHEHVE
jgi:cysteine desulfurase